MSEPIKETRPRVSPLLSALKQRTPEPEAAADASGQGATVKELKAFQLARGEGAEAEARRKPDDASGEAVDATALFDDRATGALARRKAARHRRRWGLIASFLLVVMLPTIITTAYYLFIASDQYVTEVKFALRSVERRGGNDTVGATTAVPSAVADIADSFIIADYIATRQFVDELDSKVGLRAMMSRPEGDFWARLPADAPVESLVNHWRSVVNSRFELSTGILSVRVRAFTPEDSYRLAEAVIDGSERLANDLTARGRQDFVRFAEVELKGAERRLQAAREALSAFRVSEGVVDPIRTATNNADLIAKLRTDLTALRAEASALAASMDAGAPPMQTINRRIRATEQQLQSVEADSMRNGRTANGDMAGLLSRFAALEAEQTFAEKSYSAALEALHNARSVADRQQVYLATYVRPALPQSPQYPHRPQSIALAAGLALLAWLIGTLLVLGVRDHMR